MAMGHVILTEFFRDRQVDYFTDYVKTYTDAPFLVTLRGGARRMSRTGSSPQRISGTPRRVLRKNRYANAATGATVAPNGTLGFRYSDSGRGAGTSTSAGSIRC